MFKLAAYLLDSLWARFDLATYRRNSSILRHARKSKDLSRLGFDHPWATRLLEQEERHRKDKEKN